MLFGMRAQLMDLCRAVFAELVALCVECSRVTRSLVTVKTAAKRQRAFTVGTALLHSQRAPYWMRHPRTVSADSTSSTAAPATNGGCDLETVASDAGNSVHHRASTSYSCDDATEAAASSRRAHKIQTSDSNCVCSQPASSPSIVVRSRSGRKPITSEASSRLSQLNSVEGLSSSVENVHCSDGRDCCPCTTQSSDNVGSICTSTDSPCLKTLPACTNTDRPWVSMSYCVICYSIHYMFATTRGQICYQVSIVNTFNASDMLMGPKSSSCQAWDMLTCAII